MPLRSIEQDHPEFSASRMARIGQRTVPTANIVGTCSINADRFNPDWSPTARGRDYRWRAVLEETSAIGAIRSESRFAAPISLFKVGDEYYVEADGNRRVSVAHLLRILTVPAEVIELERK